MTGEIPDDYILGLARDVPPPRLANLYHGDFQDPGLPMCRHGWNRRSSDGTVFAYSIFRGNYGKDGVCAICLRRAQAGKEGVEGEMNYGNRILPLKYDQEMQGQGSLPDIRSG